ncbi:MAG: hypothetical protein CVU11_14080 [Bacteroidetes bacterium HGW-Bacteroidetes-6]|nr:MAG: hypothetical protein CVU11_14080 [Bacteroidetes bacterium HGW-Bacteroidetes-6]
MSLNVESKHCDAYYEHVLNQQKAESTLGAVYDLISDISDRRGLKQEWCEIDGEIQDEIIDKWQKIISSYNNWILLSDKKPEAGQWLLVYAPSGRHIAWYNGFQFEDRADYNIEGVTHWMHIPKPIV